MAKKIVTRYDFDPANNTITIAGIYQLERVLAITNVTAAQSIYMFNDPNMGVVSHALKKPENETVLVLEYDCSAMSASDNIQVFVETDYTIMEPSESLLDPVNKLRVSTPQNLIDTDFEYGLQPSKWETMELVNNIPSFYSNSADYVIPDIVSVATVQGTENITVTSSEPHGVSVGSPIDVRGLSDISLEGKYLVVSVPSDNVFIFKANTPARATANVKTSYTSIIPGQFYTGSDIKFDKSEGIYSDKADPSTLTVNTDYTHGFVPNSSVYLTNTIASRRMKVDDSSATAPDSRTYLDIDDTYVKTLTPDLTKTETKEMTGTYALKVDASSIVNGKIVWPGFKGAVGEALLYITSQGDAPITGLERFKAYLVKAVNGDEVTICAATNNNYSGNAAINLTGGTFNYGKHQFIHGYSIQRFEKYYRSYDTYARFNAYSSLLQNGYTFSKGRYGYWGPSNLRPDYNLFIVEGSISVIYTDPQYTPTYGAGQSGHTIGGTGNFSTEYNPIEDYRRFGYLNNSNTNNSYFNSESIRVYAMGGYRYWNSGTQYTNGTAFYFPLMKDPEGDTLYVENHGLENGDFANITAGDITVRFEGSTAYNATPLTVNLGTGTYEAENVTNNRIRIKYSGGTRLNKVSTGLQLSADVTNPTRDSLYIPEHSLFDNQKVKVTFNGIAPTVLTGAVQPVAKTIQTVYDSVKLGVESVVENQLANNIGLLYQSGNRPNYPYDASFTNTSKGTQYIRYYMNNWYISANKGAYYANTFGGVTQTANEAPWDPFASTPYAGDGYFMIQSPFSARSERQYHLEVFQIPNKNSGSTYTFFDEYWRSFATTNEAYVNYNNRYTSKTVLSNGFEGTYDIGVISPFSGYQGYLCVTAFVTNTGWSNYFSNWDANIGQQQSWSPWGRLAGSTVGNSYVIRAMIPLSSTTTTPQVYTTSGSVYSGLQLATLLMNQVVSALGRPSLPASPFFAYASPVNASRFALKDLTSNTAYNFNSTGSGLINIETEELTGGADGYYKITGATETSFSMQTPSEIPGRRLDGTFANIDANGININSHKFYDGQKVTYVEVSGSVTGLSSNTTYYVSSDGPDYFNLAETYEQALAKDVLSLSSTDGVFYFESPVISGIGEATGTVTLTEGSNRIIGTGSLFKSYFKPGDTIRVKDTGTTPPSFITMKVSTVVDDTELSVTTSAPTSVADTNYYTETRMNVKPDGAYLHRPFDGGVDITAGTSPNSSIVRQTRKYFRYQSGKGIQVSLAINFKPSRVANTVRASGTSITVTTLQPHGIVAGNIVRIKGATDDAYNGSFTIDSSDTYSFTYTSETAPASEVAAGIVTYNIDSYVNSVIRAGLFDYQNGMFFEYDGQEVFAVRRSSTQQLPGTCTVATDSNKIFGENTKYLGQLRAGEYIVVRGSSYLITKVVSDSELHIQPSYKGISASNVVMTKTEDTRVPQSLWNYDRADGTGPSGYVLDPTKIQMAYIDYSWYGAGKIRFGFKDTYGHVRYMHEFVHNNQLEEAYMRSGNIPARYEISNYNDPTYVPSLFHWGTSVIMDGKFDDDKAYLFTAASKDLLFTNGDTNVVSTSGSSQLISNYNRSRRTYDWFVRIPFNTATASQFSSGAKLYTADGQLNGQEIDYTTYSGGAFNVHIYITSSWNAPSVYPQISGATQVGVGAPIGGGGAVDLTNEIPLISIRLAPSVDNNLTGALGAREIINRMQLQLKSLGITLTHDCEVDLILNGSVDNISFENVENPSLSELIRHQEGDQVIGGSKIFSFRASGGSTDSSGARLSNTSEFDLSQITDLGNSILGGDGVFPNGPDMLTIAIKPVDTSNISSDSPLKVASRVTWTESQA